jgi:hypothetical protein
MAKSLTIAGVCAVLLALSGCAERPRCIQRSPTAPVLPECNENKTAVCGDDPMTTYITGMGAGNGNVRPICEEGENPATDQCRIPVTCPGVDQDAVCADGTNPLCIYDFSG